MIYVININIIYDYIINAYRERLVPAGDEGEETRREISSWVDRCSRVQTKAGDLEVYILSLQTKLEMFFFYIFNHFRSQLDSMCVGMANSKRTNMWK